MIFSFVFSVLGTISFAHIDYTPMVNLYKGGLAMLNAGMFNF